MFYRFVIFGVKFQSIVTRTDYYLRTFFITDATGPSAASYYSIIL